MSPEFIQHGLTEAWRKNNLVNQKLLGALSVENLALSLSRKGSRTIAGQFAHMHAVRGMWLQVAAPKKFPSFVKLQKDESNPEVIAGALDHSALMIEDLLKESVIAGGKIKGTKFEVFSFLGYLISHEAHHRGNILLTLKVSGCPVEKELSFGIWEWDKL
jgi:uncharacterized damage-inducible protein DinB